VKALVLGIGGPALTPEERALFARAGVPAGFILFARNITTASALEALTADLRSLATPPPFILIDQEGGRVARLRPPLAALHPPAQAIGALFRRDAEAGLRAAWLTGALIGAELAAFGIDTDAAPVLDLADPLADPVIGDRAFDRDPDHVALLGRAMAEGLMAAGVAPVMKHIPGHGRARADSHVALPVVAEGPDLLARDLSPFARNADLPFAMTAHILYPAWDGEHPATLSPAVIGRIIRQEIGFGGVLISDDLGMGALSGALPARAEAAFAAGIDLVLHASGTIEDNAALLAAAPALSPPLAARLAQIRARIGALLRPLDPARLRAERAELGLGLG
jgi:beta-N-acetylhexosaminidase